eukprot:3027931-Pleurochrysis_carterae.AAC.2
MLLQRHETSSYGSYDGCIYSREYCARRYTVYTYGATKATYVTRAQCTYMDTTLGSAAAHAHARESRDFAA